MGLTRIFNIEKLLETALQHISGHFAFWFLSREVWARGGYDLFQKIKEVVDVMD